MISLDFQKGNFQEKWRTMNKIHEFCHFYLILGQSLEFGLYIDYPRFLPIKNLNNAVIKSYNYILELQIFVYERIT